jgi:hypothetical protein
MTISLEPTEKMRPNTQMKASPSRTIFNSSTSLTTESNARSLGNVHGNNKTPEQTLIKDIHQNHKPNPSRRLLHFELRRLYSCRSLHGVAPYEAASVAMALKNAAASTISRTTLSDLSFFDAVLDRAVGIYNGDVAQTEVKASESVKKLDQDATLEQLICALADNSNNIIQRQQDEIRCLRSAVKELISLLLHAGKSNGGHHSDFPDIIEVNVPDEISLQSTHFQQRTDKNGQKDTQDGLRHADKDTPSLSNAGYGEEKLDAVNLDELDQVATGVTESNGHKELLTRESPLVSEISQQYANEQVYPLPTEVPATDEQNENEQDGLDNVTDEVQEELSGLRYPEKAFEQAGQLASSGLHNEPHLHLDRYLATLEAIQEGQVELYEGECDSSEAGDFGLQANTHDDAIPSETNYQRNTLEQCLSVDYGAVQPHDIRKLAAVEKDVEDHQQHLKCMLSECSHEEDESSAQHDNPHESCHSATETPESDGNSSFLEENAPSASKGFHEYQVELQENHEASTAVHERGGEDSKCTVGSLKRFGRHDSSWENKPLQPPKRHSSSKAILEKVADALVVPSDAMEECQDASSEEERWSPGRLSLENNRIKKIQTLLTKKQQLRQFRLYPGDKGDERPDRPHRPPTRRRPEEFAGLPPSTIVFPENLETKMFLRELEPKLIG